MVIKAPVTDSDTSVSEDRVNVQTDSVYTLEEGRARDIVCKKSL